MQKLIIAVLCLTIHCQLWAQQVDTVNAASDRYIYLYRTVGGIQISHYYCFLEDGQQVLVVKKPNVMATIVLEKPNIFELVEKSQQEIIAVRARVETKKDPEAVLAEFKNYNTIASQLGIKSSYLEYNHFTAKSQKFIAGVKDETTRKGLQVINQIIAILDKAAQAVKED